MTKLSYTPVWCESVIFNVKTRNKKLEKKQKRNLKAQAHDLKPVILIGEKGLTENVHNEIDVALEAHELIKIKAFRAPKEYKEDLSAEITVTNRCELIAIIGNIMIFYRKNPKKVINKVTTQIR